MAEVGSQWYSPFDPQDPDALASAAVGTNPQQYVAQVATRPHSRAAQRRAASLAVPTTPNEEVAGSFGALDVARRDEPGYPGSFLHTGSGFAFDPAATSEAKVLGVPVESGGFWARDTRAPTVEDLFNPIGVQAGYQHIGDAWNQIVEAHKNAAVAQKAEEDANFQRYEEDRLRREAEQRKAMQDYNDRLRKRREVK